MDQPSLLKIRKAMKARKPTFTRKDTNKKKRIEDDVWRRPRGVDNKQRLKKKGHVKNPGMGYRSPLAVRGLHSSGLVPLLVCSERDLEKATKENGIIISSLLGGRKRKLIIELSRRQGLEIINLEADKALGRIEHELAERKRLKQERTSKASKKPETKPSKEEVKQDQPSDEDEKKKLEKQEKDKVLTKKQ